MPLAKANSKKRPATLFHDFSKEKKFDIINIYDIKSITEGMKTKIHLYSILKSISESAGEG
jgi:hypothetical protein